MTEYWDKAFDTTLPLKCPECGGNMIATEENEKQVHFKCPSGHIWIKDGFLISSLVDDRTTA